MIYFLEGEKSISPGLLERFGLDSVLESPKCRELARGGPGIGCGLLITDNASPGDFRYVEQSQTWAPRFGFEKSHVGFWTDNPPTPATLARSEQIAGTPVRCQDENEWVVPLLRQWTDNDDSVGFVTKLRTVLSRSPITGNLVSGPVIKPLRDIWSRSCELCDSIIEQMKEDGRFVLDTDQTDRFIADVLALNYRIGLDEIGVLGLLDTELYPEIIYAALDLRRLIDIAGKVERRRTVGESDPTTNTSFESGQTPPTAEGATVTAPQ